LIRFFFTLASQRSCNITLYAGVDFAKIGLTRS
jgi:hypothetical protein